MSLDGDEAGPDELKPMTAQFGIGVAPKSWTELSAASVPPRHGMRKFDWVSVT